MSPQLVVIAKEPMPGRVKTRLCPPCTPQQAADLAAAALADTIAVVTRAPAARRVLLLDGKYPSPPGWKVVAQRGEGLGQRLALGFADTAHEKAPTILVGMDTPQVRAENLEDISRALVGSDAVLGFAEDGGWWTLGLRDPAHAQVLVDVPMSQPDTGERTWNALTSLGIRVARTGTLRDVDTVGDLEHVAAQCRESRFAAAVAALTA